MTRVSPPHAQLIEQPRSIGSAKTGIHFRHAFSLVELAIVLVILGLLVGGIVTGKSLIESAAINSQIRQINQYRTAAQAFKDKYFFMPGDIPNGAAFGFNARTACPGAGDGNGLIEGLSSTGSPCAGSRSAGSRTGESLIFWQDLKKSGLVELPLADSGTGTYYAANISSRNPALCFPEAKLGNQQYVSVWSGGYTVAYDGSSSDGYNYISVSGENSGDYCAAFSTAFPSFMKVQHLHNIDTKIDDGKPQSGLVLALKPGFNDAVWAAATGRGASTQTCCYGGSPSTFNRPTTVATPYATTNCYDNNNTGGVEQSYSLQNADSPNCSLSMRM
jgi:prepilin-type N-terminal cleavage/methylation domain-containing protein